MSSMIVWTSCIISMRSDQTSRKSLCQVTWCAEGTSFIKDGIRYEGAAVTTEEAVIWAEALPPGASLQKAKLLALTKALQLEKGERLNIYTDSWYEFATIHVAGSGGC